MELPRPSARLGAGGIFDMRRALDAYNGIRRERRYVLTFGHARDMRLSNDMGSAIQCIPNGGRYPDESLEVETLDNAHELLGMLIHAEIAELEYRCHAKFPSRHRDVFPSSWTSLPVDTMVYWTIGRPVDSQVCDPDFMGVCGSVLVRELTTPIPARPLQKGLPAPADTPLSELIYDDLPIQCDPTPRYDVEFTRDQNPNGMPPMCSAAFYNAIDAVKWAVDQVRCQRASSHRYMDTVDRNMIPQDSYSVDIKYSIPVGVKWPWAIGRLGDPPILTGTFEIVDRRTRS